MRGPRLLLLDPYTGGHHAEHLAWITQAWVARSVPGHLSVVVAPELLRAHPRLQELGGEDVSWHAPPLATEAGTPASLLRSGVRLGRLLRQTAEKHQPQQILLMYADHAQLALGLRTRLDSAVRLSGILFRPTLHYSDLGHPPSGVKEWAKWLRKKTLLRAALAHPRLETVFTLDPLAVPALSELAPSVRAVHLPDPSDVGSAVAESSAVRASYGVEASRYLAVLFGSLEERKGLFVLLDALRLLPLEVARRLSVVIAGRAYPETRERLHAKAELAAADTEVQVILREEFLPPDELQHLIGSADLVLAPYQRHVGSSGVLMRAAEAGKPLITQDYGLLGHQVSQHRLGQAVDTTAAPELARALERFVDAPATGFDPTSAGAFASAHTVEAYVDTLFGALLR